MTGKPSHLLIYHQGKHDITVPALPIIYPRRSPCGTQSCTYVVGSRLRFLRKSQPAPKSRTQGLISICQQLPYLKLQDFFIFLFEGFFLKSFKKATSFGTWGTTIQVGFCRTVQGTSQFGKSPGPPLDVVSQTKFHWCQCTVGR